MRCYWGDTLVLYIGDIFFVLLLFPQLADRQSCVTDLPAAYMYYGDILQKKWTNSTRNQEKLRAKEHEGTKKLSYPAKWFVEIEWEIQRGIRKLCQKL